MICDATSEQKSENLKKFLGEIGTRLKVLERGTPWANKAELFIGLMKESVRKDMRISNCPLGFWDCVERRARINNLAVLSAYPLHGETPHNDVFHTAGDI